MRISHFAFVLLFNALQCLGSDDSEFVLTNKATGLCLVEYHFLCLPIRWTTAGRLLIPFKSKCLGVQGKSVGSEVSLYDCDETSDLQKWECKNETVLALQGQQLYIEIKEDNTAVLSKTIGPNNHLTISGTTSGACTRTYREFYTIGGNAAGRPCMFPFLYNNMWFSDCTMEDFSGSWCAVETKYEQNELWGSCPSNNKEMWTKHPTTGAKYQLNTQSALTWSEAAASCKQQSASLLSITDPHEHAYITTLLQPNGVIQGYKLWTGLVMDPEHGWKWSNGNPFRYLNWDSGYPLQRPGYLCGMIDGTVQFSWQNTNCNKKLGYICYSKGVVAAPTEALQTGFCSAPWIPYNGHCFFLNRTKKTWSDAQVACRKEGGDLVSIRNVEDQSFVISQLGYASNDELWIGLNDRKTERLFDWSDHSTVSFTNWESGKPAISSEGEDCVLIRGENGNWADHVCREKHGFICMKASASEPSGDEVEQNEGCKTGWKRHGSYCYLIGTESKTFDEAMDDCKSSDSYLADVSTGVDNAFLVSLLGLRPEKHFWLGLSNHKDIDVFVWTNTKSVRFTHWNAEMPGHRQGCVAMATGSFAGLWDVLPCTSKEKYICKHMAAGAVLTPAPPTAPSTTCADGWEKVDSRNFCFKFYSGNLAQKTWYESRDYCRAIGGDLLSIHSDADLGGQGRGINFNHYSSFLRYLRMSGTYWIGLSAPDPVTGYVWSDGSPVNFLHWKENEPNNKNNVESCVEFYGYNWNQAGSWNDNRCEKYNDWICQIPTGVTPKLPPEPVTPDFNETSDGWLEWKGNQYYINEKRMAMEDARRFCKKRHGDLVTINSEDESLFLWKRISKNYGFFWIGLTVDFDGSFQWMDGSETIFYKWEDGQPDFKNFDENCAVMTSETGFWHDRNCGYIHRSICKRSSSPAANTTVAPTVQPKGGCQLPWIKFNTKCYNIIKDQNLTWHDARDKCKGMGGNLASVRSREVQVFLMSQMVDTPTTDLWIGLHTLHEYGLYWTDGRPRSYLNTASIYPRDNKCYVINTSPSLGIGKWIPKSCNDTNGFVCLRDVDSSLPDSPEPTASTSYIEILRDSIKVVPQQMSWEAAKKHCEGDGANLASLRTEWTQAYVEFLALKLNTSLWIGLNKDQTNGIFKYIDGWHMTFSDWSSDVPRRGGACVYVDVDGKWKTANCSQPLNSVCMKSTANQITQNCWPCDNYNRRAQPWQPAGMVACLEPTTTSNVLILENISCDVPPTESTVFPGVCPENPEESSQGQHYFWIPFRGYCYIFVTEIKEWPVASLSCVAHGGTLASIEDPAEEDFILSNIQRFQDSYSFFWLGLFKTHKEQWLWLDKTVMDYNNWDEDQPTYYTYGGITTGKKWTGRSKWHDSPYICKTAKVIPPKPSALPTGPPSSHHERDHITLAVVLVVVGIALGTFIALFIYKKTDHHLPIPDKLTTFDNPLFFSKKQSQADMVDTKQLIENAEDTQPILMI